MFWPQNFLKNSHFFMNINYKYPFVAYRRHTDLRHQKKGPRKMQLLHFLRPIFL